MESAEGGRLPRSLGQYGTPEGSFGTAISPYRSHEWGRARKRVSSTGRRWPRQPSLKRRSLLPCLVQPFGFGKGVQFHDAIVATVCVHADDSAARLEEVVAQEKEGCPFYY